MFWGFKLYLELLDKLYLELLDVVKFFTLC